MMWSAFGGTGGPAVDVTVVVVAVVVGSTCPSWLERLGALVPVVGVPVGGAVSVGTSESSGVTDWCGVVAVTALDPSPSGTACPPVVTPQPDSASTDA